MELDGGLRIERAQAKHVGEIAALAEANRLEAIGGELASDRGFLVSGFDATAYGEFLVRADHFYVLLDGQSVSGFLLAYSSERIQADQWVDSHLKSLYPEHFVLVKQVCIKAEMTSQGHATRFYEYLLSQAKDHPLFAAIALDPPNWRSVRFHERMGFKKVLEMRPPDGITRGIWRWNAPSAETLHVQYEMAINLYAHEDQLNWSKLNNLFYMTGGLIAAVGFIFGFDATSSFRTLLLVLLCLVGTAMSAGFAIALWFGVLYMQERKHSAEKIEDALGQFGGLPIVSTEPLRGKWRRWFLKVSPTTWVLRVIPIFFLGIWLALLAVVVFSPFKDV